MMNLPCVTSLDCTQSGVTSPLAFSRSVMASQCPLVFNWGGSDVRVKANTSKSTISWQIEQNLVVSWFSELVLVCWRFTCILCMKRAKMWLEADGFGVRFFHFFFELAFMRSIFCIFSVATLPNLHITIQDRERWFYGFIVDRDARIIDSTLVSLCPRNCVIPKVSFPTLLLILKRKCRHETRRRWPWTFRTKDIFYFSDVRILKMTFKALLPVWHKKQLTNYHIAWWLRLSSNKVWQIRAVNIWKFFNPWRMQFLLTFSQGFLSGTWKSMRSRLLEFFKNVGNDNFLLNVRQSRTFRSCRSWPSRCLHGSDTWISSYKFCL